MAMLVIAEAETPAGLALARALAAIGHEVVASFSDASAPVRVSRVVHSAVRVPAAGAQPGAFVAALAQLSARTGARPCCPGPRARCWR